VNEIEAASYSSVTRCC